MAGLVAGLLTCLDQGQMTRAAWKQQTFRAIVAVTLVAGVFISPAGCRRSGRDEADQRRPAEAAATNPAASQAPEATARAAGPAGTSPSPAAAPKAAAGSDSATEPLARSLALQGEYRRARSFDDRFEVATRLGAEGTAEAVAALERLFVQEPDKELRVELINALIGMSDCKQERLRFLKLAIEPGQPVAVREAATDGLVDLEDARALPLLQGLFNDPDPALAALARRSHALLSQMLHAP